MLQWISWHQPTDDYRPLTAPPNAGILGWWCTGEGKDGMPTLCALVAAGSERAARAIVRKDWPEADDWRFCEPRDDVQLGTRFPFDDWMLERIAAVEANAKYRPLSERNP